MKKFFLISICTLCSYTLFAQEDGNGKWSMGFSANFGIEEQLGLMGLKYDISTDYSIIDRLGVTLSLGSFQSISRWDPWRIQNSSQMLLSLNLFGDVLKFGNGNHRIRLSAGGTYFLGDIAHANWYIINGNDYIPFAYKVDLYNNIGLNAKISYLYSITDRWNIGFNVHGYEIFDEFFDGLFVHIISVGFSAGYRF